MNKLITTPHVEIVTDNFCRHCGRPVAARDNFCSECGTNCRDLIEINHPIARSSIGPVTANRCSQVTVEEMPTIKAILNSRLAVIGIIAIAGPLGLPALWFSPRFGNRTKILATLIYVLLAAVLPLAIAWYWLDYSVRPLVEVFGR